MRLPTPAPNNTEKLQGRATPEARTQLKTSVPLLACEAFAKAFQARTLHQMCVAHAKETEARAPLQKRKARAQAWKASAQARKARAKLAKAHAQDPHQMREVCTQANKARILLQVHEARAKQPKACTTLAKASAPVKRK